MLVGLLYARVGSIETNLCPTSFKISLVGFHLIGHRTFNLLWKWKSRFLIRNIFLFETFLLDLLLLCIISNANSIHTLNDLENLLSPDTSNIRQTVHIINNISSNCQKPTILVPDQITKSPVSVFYLGHGFKRQPYSDFYSFVWSIAQAMLTIA